MKLTFLQVPLYSTLFVLTFFIASCEKEEEIKIEDNQIGQNDTTFVVDTIFTTDTLVIHKNDSCETANKPLITRRLEAYCHVSSYLPYRWITGYQLDNVYYCQNSSQWADMLMVAVFDPNNALKPLHCREHGNKGHINYHTKLIEGWNEYNFYYHSSSEQGMNSMSNFLDSLPNDYYVLIYSFRQNNIGKHLKNGNMLLKNTLEQAGADVNYHTSYNEAPYILFYKKGDKSSVKEAFYDENSFPDGTELGERFIKIEAIMSNQ